MGNVVGGLLYLRVTALRNAVVSRFMRLRQPKYLLGAVIGVAYLYLVFLRRFRTNGSGAPGLAGMFPEQLPMVATLGALCLLIFVALLWVWSRERASLTFSEAEIAFLFPAPLSRKTLIHFRLISTQMSLLFTSLIFALLSSGWSFLQGNAAIRILGWWIVFSTMSLHITGSSFAMTRWLDRGITQLRRQSIAFGIIAVLTGVSVFWISREWRAPTTEDLVNFSSVANYFVAMPDVGPLHYLLLPAKWLMQPLLAADLRSFLAALGPALLVFAAHYLWVLYSEASFEEGSIVKAKKRAERVAAMRAGNVRLGRSVPKARRTPFDVSSVPRVELAFFWKNLLSSAEYLRLRTALITALVILVGSQWLAHSDYDILRTAIGSVALGIAVYALVFGPLIARQDLRNDLLNADILKTYPLRGWQIVLGEILTPVAIVTVLLWLMLLTAALNFQPRGQWLTNEIRVWGAVGVALLIPLLCAIQVLVLNAGVVLFPAWMQVGQSRGAGIDVLGQRIFFIAALFITIGAALLPAAVAASAIYFSVQWVVDIPIAAALAAATLLGILCFEIGLGVQWLGKRFENFDLSAELRP